MSKFPMPLKQWVFEQAEASHLPPNAIYSRFKRGKYPNLKIERKNKRVVTVLGV